MSKLYPIELSAENVGNIICDGDLYESRFMDFVPNEALHALDKIGDDYDRTAWGIFNAILRTDKSSLPWGYVFLDRDYAIAKSIRRMLPENSGIRFSEYSAFSSGPGGSPSMGYVWIRKKDDLAKVADTSVFWKVIWRMLSEVSSKTRWLALPDPLPRDWAQRMEAPGAFNVKHKVAKANAEIAAKNDDDAPGARKITAVIFNTSPQKQPPKPTLVVGGNSFSEAKFDDKNES